MSLKIPDIQVLLGRTDQIPKVLKEGDPSGAGKLATGVSQQIDNRPKRVSERSKTDRSRDKKERERHKKKKGKSQPSTGPLGGGLDIRI